MKQSTFYLKESDHTNFKIKCMRDGIPMTMKLQELVQEYISTPTLIEDTEHNTETKTNFN